MMDCSPRWVGLFGVLFVVVSLLGLARNPNWEASPGATTSVDTAVGGETVTPESLLKQSRYSRQQSLSESLRLIEQAMRQAESEGHTQLLPKLYLETAQVHLLMGNYTVSTEYALKVLKRAKEIGDSTLICDAWNKIGTLHHYQENYPKAMEYFEQSLVLAQVLADSNRMSRAFRGQGHIFRLRGEYDQALTQYEACIEYRQLKTRNRFRDNVWSDISKVYYASGELNVALHYQQKSLARLKRHPTERYHTLSNAYINLATIYVDLGQPRAALPVAEEGLRLAGLQGNRVHLKEHYLNLSKIHSDLGNYAAAYDFQQRYSAIKDTLYQMETQWRIADMEARVERERQEKTIVELNRQSEIDDLKLAQSDQAMFLVLAGSAGVILITVLLVVLYRQNQRKKNVELREKLLRNQMDPHFIFNSLMAIQSFLVSNESDEAFDYLSKYAELTRMILENSKRESVELEDELVALKHYMELQNLRFGSRIDCRVEVDLDVNLFEVQLPPMLLQPFIENAFEHGLAHLEEGAELLVHIYTQPDGLVLDVLDNGKGIGSGAPAASKKHLSMATRITRQRLDLLNRSQGRKIKMTISDRKDEGLPGTRVRFELPLVPVRQPIYTGLRRLFSPQRKRVPVSAARH